MKARKKTKPSKNKKIFLIAAALLIAGLGGFWLYNNYVKNETDSNKSRINLDAPTQADKEIVDQHKEDLSNDQDKDDNPDEPEGQITLSLDITRASQLGDGQPLNIRTLIGGTRSGECQVTLTKGGQATVSKTFEVMFEATSASCADANIPASEFGAGGDWNLKVVVVNGSQKSNTVEQTVTIEK